MGVGNGYILELFDTFKKLLTSYKRTFMRINITREIKLVGHVFLIMVT
jgi:hypothetical protein